MAWSDKRVSVLKEHWEAGKTSVEIAEILGGGISPKAVLGKVHRLGLQRITETVWQKGRYFWTEEREAALKWFWGEGKSAPQIAKIFGGATSPSSVLRKAKELRLKIPEGKRPYLIWSVESEKRLKKLWAEGKSPEEIAKVLGQGLSASAVDGKANRLGIKEKVDEETRLLDIAVKRTRLERWVPGVREQMLAMGLRSLKQLWDRVQKLQKENPDFFGNLDYASVAQAVSGSDDGKIFRHRKRDYSRVAYAIASALNKSPEEVFGAARPPKAHHEETESQDKRLKAVFEDVMAPRESDPFEFCVGDEFKARLGKAIQKLSPRQKEAIDLYFGLGDRQFSLEEIAALNGTTRQNVHRALSKGLKSLAKTRELRIYADPAYRPVGD